MSQTERSQHHRVNFQLMSCSTIGQVYRRVLFHIGKGYENLQLHWWCDRTIDKQPMHTLLNLLNLPEDVDISARCTKSVKNRSRIGMLSSTINNHSTSSQPGNGTFYDFRTLPRQNRNHHGSNNKRSNDSSQKPVTKTSLSSNYTTGHPMQDPTPVTAHLSNISTTNGKTNRTPLEGALPKSFTNSKKLSFDTLQDNSSTFVKQFSTITQQHSEDFADTPNSKIHSVISQQEKIAIPLSNISRPSDSYENIQDNEDLPNEFLTRFSETSSEDHQTPSVTNTKSQTPISVEQVRTETTSVHDMSIEMARDNTANETPRLDDSLISEARDFDCMMETKRQAKSPLKQDSQSFLIENNIESPDLSRLQSLSKDSNPRIEAIVRSYLKEFFNETANSSDDRKRSSSSTLDSDMNQLNEGSKTNVSPSTNLSEITVKPNISANGKENLNFSTTTAAAGESLKNEKSHILSLLTESSADDHPTFSKEPPKSPKSFCSNSTQAMRLYRQSKVDTDKDELASTSKTKLDSNFSLNQEMIHEEKEKSKITSSKMKTYLLPDSFCGDESPVKTPRNENEFDKSFGTEADLSQSIETARHVDNFIFPDPTIIQHGNLQNITKRRKKESPDFNIRDLLPPPPRYDELPVTHDQINLSVDPLFPEVIDFIKSGKPASDIPRQSTVKSPSQQQLTQLYLSPINATTSKKQPPKCSSKRFQSTNNGFLSDLNPIIEADDVNVINSGTVLSPAGERNASFIPPITTHIETMFVPENMAPSSVTCETTQTKPRTLSSFLRRTYTQAVSHPSYIEILDDVSESVFETLDEISHEMQHEIGEEPFNKEDEFLLVKLVECMGSEIQWDRILYTGWSQFGNRRSAEDLKRHYNEMVRENSIILNRVKLLFQSQ